MKRAASYLLGTALLAAIAQAQTIGPGLKASVPFEFKAGSAAMPAGDYLLTSRMPGVLQISRTAGKETALLVVSSASAVPDAGGMLVFNRYSNEYFLSKALPPGGVSGLVLRPSRREREHMAKGSPKAVTVIAEGAR